MGQYLRQHSTRSTPQSEPMSSDQRQNPAGGFAWPVDDWTRARRFLILGAEGGTYYVGQRELVKDNAAALERCLAEDPMRTIEMICDISDGGLAKSNDPALFALAMAVGSNDLETRREAWRRLPQVARIGTHLFHFVAYMQQFRGWGPLARRGVSAWYEGKEADKLAYQLVKYRQRDGWSHRDVLRRAHPKAPSELHKALYDFACGREFGGGVIEGEGGERALNMIEGYLAAQKAASPAESARLIGEHDLPREAVKTDHLTSPEVWEALLRNMPITAMIRNLANLTRVGIIKPMSDGEKLVAERLGDEERLRKGRVHPIAVLSALTIYERGHSALGRGEDWTPSQKVVDALDAAFYTAFGSVEPANKRTLIAVDVSGSMGWGDIAGVPGLTPRVGAAAMSLVTASTEPDHAITAFSHTMVPVSVSPRQRMDDVLRTFDALPMGGTDCALPMIYAEEMDLEIDTFIAYTDSETWAGEVHPAQALRTYREKTGINARLIVVGMVSSEFSIADPNDGGMLDVVGFDSAAPATMSAFSRGEV
jgi:60 kDa SS-A/Ro ribonucleoprotein